jgi:PH domain/leucine-rich repeat-containing protein phosphatase
MPVNISFTRHSRGGKWGVLSSVLSQVKAADLPRLSLTIPAALFAHSNIRCFKIDQPSAGDASGAPAVWSHGYTEASGVKNKYVV